MDLPLVVADDRVAVRRLVAGEPERVERERVLVGRRALLLQQAAEDAELDRVGIHAAERTPPAGRIAPTPQRRRAAAQVTSSWS